MLKNNIPTIIGILLLLVGAVFGVIFVDQETGFLPRATPEYIPQKVKITNISHTGFTISWITQEPAIGFIKHGLSADDLTTTITDERDQITGSSGAYRSHYVTVQDLSPSTTYYFKIGSQGKQLYDNHGNAFSLTTAPQIPAPTAASTAYGTVLTPADTPAEGALVYLSLPGSTPLSALVKQNGNWTIDLATARTRDLSDYVTYHPQDTVVDIFLQADNGETAQIITKTNNIQPVPNIIIGKSADYSGKEPIYLLEQTPDPLHQSNFSIQEIMVTEPEASAQVTLDTTPADDTIITQSRPVLTGTAPPGAQITITIHSSQVITGSIIAGADGSWNWQPPLCLLAAGWIAWRWPGRSMADAQLLAPRSIEEIRNRIEGRVVSTAVPS